MHSNRRAFLSAGSVTVLSALAGCSDLLQEDVEFDDNVPDPVADHLETANNVDGSITDRTGESELTVAVGPGGNFAYDPALIAVDTETTVTWEWESPGHTVTGVSSNFEIDTGRESDGFDTSFTFDTPGTYLYECEPHSSAGHRGAIIVE
jgi:halocyanin-like protein